MVWMMVLRMMATSASVGSPSTSARSFSATSPTPSAGTCHALATFRRQSSLQSWVAWHQPCPATGHRTATGHPALAKPHSPGHRPPAAGPATGPAKTSLSPVAFFSRRSCQFTGGAHAGCSQRRSPWLRVLLGYPRAPFLPMFCVRSGARAPEDAQALLPGALDFRCRLREAPLPCSSLHSIYVASLQK